MNPHHLELFYYVAKHQGVSQAVRHIPYGIQQPAVSEQMIELEDQLGKKLFNRQPFSLTPAGKDLYDFVIPFFGNISQVKRTIQGDANQHLRIASSGTLLRDHIHEILRKVKKEFPEVKLTLREVNQPEAEGLLMSHDIDLAISMLDKKVATGLHCSKLVQVPMVLLVNRKAAPQTLHQVLEKKDELPLVSLPEVAAFTKLFQSELKRRKIEWSARIEVDSLDLVRDYVSNEFGVGLGFAGCLNGHSSQIREVSLRGFPQVRVAAFWKDKLPILARYFLNQVKGYAHQLAEEFRSHGYLNLVEKGSMNGSGSNSQV